MDINIYMNELYRILYMHEYIKSIIHTVYTYMQYI